MVNRDTRRAVICVLTFMLSMQLPYVFAAENKDDIVVVVSARNSIEALSRREVIDIYMGRYQSFPNGTDSDTYDYDYGNLLRQRFYLLLVGQDENKVKSYWSKLLFTGRAVPPEVLNSVDQMLITVASSENAIGYIPRSSLNASVKVVHELGTVTTVE